MSCGDPSAEEFQDAGWIGIGSNPGVDEKLYLDGLPGKELRRQVGAGLAASCVHEEHKAFCQGSDLLWFRPLPPCSSKGPDIAQIIMSCLCVCFQACLCEMRDSIEMQPSF